ncbi:RAQPRD family integrative conjugative element protein [Salmonella enterica]|uniref:Conjugal transfer protein n=1 Tax=Salmonella enterica subsp. VII serovar 40:z4,z24:[z39] TaxID=1967625 RepID=A0A731TKB8_SALEE|nr:conjugal transfer protein [Salmonella enterica]EDO5298491.1 conjugal transfer protein [Salmonella enterica subsp. houtenae serovar 40:z4,z24:-]EDS6441947.1 conjugal transfer protein [Salmonella enterica subsp. VII str. CFSAN000550]EDU7901887.1 conjugal transfer protein [Salmonella enterica subsp. houtenae]QJY67091.1 conjugal transfer protein [Salmonella enterica subsp. VII serovar 1,40:g,z51:--]QUZ22947.1 RAQPRD family integrative conjugative element protein [Salmonella enterica subsp. VII 
MHTITTIVISLFITSSALAAPLTEREELTLSLSQLTQIEASLHRAQLSARTSVNERYYFDYPRIHSDITTLRSGIEHYLTPTRAQPRDTATLVGQYREEKTAP